MKILNSLNDRLRHQWQDLHQSNGSNFFQSPAWLEILCRHNQHYQPVVLEGRDWVLPFVRHHRRGWISDSLYSMPMMTTGGFLGQIGPDDFTQCLVGIKQLKIGTAVIVFPAGESPHLLPAKVHPDSDPISPADNTQNLFAHAVQQNVNVSDYAELLPAGFSFETSSTQLIDCAQDWLTIWGRFTQGARNAVRFAENEGVTIECSDTESALKGHFDLLLLAEQRWGAKSNLSSAFFCDLIKTGAGRLFLAFQGQKLLGSLFALVGGLELFVWQALRNPQHKIRGVHNLLWTEAIRLGKNEGYSRINLGSSMGVEGIERFKFSLGASKVTVPVLKYTHPWVKTGLVCRQKLVEWKQQLPFSQ